jgi:hypothetical protein
MAQHNYRLRKLKTRGNRLETKATVAARAQPSTSYRETWASERKLGTCAQRRQRTVSPHAHCVRRHCKNPHDCLQASNSSATISGGLELLTRSGAWQSVVPPPGALLVNLGSLLTRWTNGRWPSTLHRVTNPQPAQRASSRRSSLAFFHKVNTDAVIDVRPSCVSATRPAAFAAVRARNVCRQGVLWRHRGLLAGQASAAYHAEMAAIRRAQEGYHKSHDQLTGSDTLASPS